MSDWVVVQVAIGIAFVYLMAGLACTEITNWISQLANLRATKLEQGIRDLLLYGDQGKLKDLYTHPLIAKLSDKKPIWIPANTFALALFDILAPADAAKPKSITDLRDAVGKLDTSVPALKDLQKTLLGLIDAGEGKLEVARKNVETWFDSRMGTVTDWYKKLAWQISLAVAAAVCLLFNVDTVVVVRSLWQDPALRAAVVTEATQVAASTTTAEDLKSAQIRQQLDKLMVPIGWYQPADPAKALIFGFLPTGWTEVPRDAWTWFLKVFGLAVSTLAASFGAPFWFDVIKKLTTRGQ